MDATIVEQRSDAWYRARLGKATASKMADICARTRNGWGASRANYKAQLVCERLTGEPTEGFTNAAMQWGTDTEPRARAAYAFLRDNPVEEVGFIDHPRIAMSGASPDGLVAGEGMVELKCPNTATHLDFLLSETIPDKYLKQMLWQMACAERQWCDFASFDPRLPEEMQLWVKRVERDDAQISEMEEIVSEFLAEVDETVARLRERYLKEAA